MDIKQLLTMITLSQTLNYQKAAEQLQYAPSTLFKHIQMLEQEVGAPLFCKTGRQLALTRQGEAFRHRQQVWYEAELSARNIPFLRVRGSLPERIAHICRDI